MNCNYQYFLLLWSRFLELAYIMLTLFPVDKLKFSSFNFNVNGVRYERYGYEMTSHRKRFPGYIPFIPNNQFEGGEGGTWKIVTVRVISGVHVHHKMEWSWWKSWFPVLYCVSLMLIFYIHYLLSFGLICMKIYAHNYTFTKYMNSRIYITTVCSYQNSRFCFILSPVSRDFGHITLGFPT